MRTGTASLKHDFNVKIIQTFCSFDQPVLQSKFGWYSAYYHLASWSLSAYSLAKFYDVTLYTDRAGYDILIGRLKLPYADVVISHDHLHYHKSAWALAKLHTFGIVKQPFLHVDGDVFIRRPFNPLLLQSGIIVQNLEMCTREYERNLNRAKDHLRYLPVIMHPDIERGEACSCNAGIIGGSDLELIHELSRLAFAIADKNRINSLRRNVLLNVNVLLEQVMLYRLLLQHNKRASCLFDEVFDDFGYTTADVADVNGDYVHLIGGHKRSKKTCERMNEVLQCELGTAHERLAALFNRKELNVFAA
jgi:hypothetical protein